MQQPVTPPDELEKTKPLNAFKGFLAFRILVHAQIQERSETAILICDCAKRLEKHRFYAVWTQKLSKWYFFGQLKS